MRVAALMPTRDRATIAHRAASTFLTAISRLPEVEAVRLVIADDSSRPSEADLLKGMVADLPGRTGNASLKTVRAAGRPESSVTSPGGGPGAARNRGLTVLSETCATADVTIMLDDDVSFVNIAYQSTDLRCDGSRLVRDALQVCGRARTIAGCGYVGRQDLSILEHARLSHGTRQGGTVVPSVRRRGHRERRTRRDLHCLPGGRGPAHRSAGLPRALQ